VQRIGKSKVTKLNAKADIAYPLIRLPKAYADEIGRTAEIFETHDGNRWALFVTFDGGRDPREVIQPSAKVIQHDGARGIENRISELESQIA
jgi:hypothetical protein